MIKGVGLVQGASDVSDVTHLFFKIVWIQNILMGRAICQSCSYLALIVQALEHFEDFEG